MKKNCLMVLAVSALLGLTGCNSNPETGSSVSDVTSETSHSSSEATSSSSNEPISSSEEKESSTATSEQAKTYDITANCDAGAKITLGVTNAEKGSEVHFTLAVLDGFKLKSIIAKAGTNEVELIVGLDGDYSFKMPARGVAISVTTERLNYKFTLNDGAKFVKSVTQKKAGTDTFVALGSASVESDADDEEGGTITTTYDTAEFGAEILLTFDTSVANYDLTGITVNGTATELKAGTGSYTFTMGAEDTSVTVSYSYKSVAFELVNSDHVTLALYSDEEGKTEIEGAYTPYTTVYLKATPSSEDYDVKTITCSYASASGSTTSKDLTALYDEDTGLYPFQYPMTTGTVTITVTEYDLHAYKSAPFIGEYMNLDFSYGPAQDYSSFTEKSSTKILESGDLVYARTETNVYSNFSVSSYEDENGSGAIQLEQAGSYALPTIAYSKHLVVFDTYLKSGVSSASDLVVGLKKEKADATYSVKATQFKIGDVTYALACFYEGDTSIENILIERTKSDYAKNAIHFGVNVEMLEGTYANEDKAIFRVKEGDNTLLSVGYTENGTAKNRITLGEEYGTYTDGDGKSLYLNGSGNATYDGTSYGYSLAEDGVTITLNSNDGVVTGTIDKTDMSFAVSKKEEATMPWKGKTYKGVPQYSSSDDDTSWSNTYQIAFANDGSILTWTELIGGKPYYTAENVTYTVENGNTVKTKFYNCANTLEKSDGYDITLAYNASGDYFTATGGTNGAYFKNTKLTLVS